MKKIYFNNILNFRKNWILKSIFLMGSSCILFGFFYSTMNEVEPVWVKRMKSVGFLLFSIYFINTVIRKNYVQWNKTGMTVKINNYFLEKRISFNDVLFFEFSNGILTINKSNGITELNLTEFDKNDI